MSWSPTTSQALVRAHAEDLRRQASAAAGHATAAGHAARSGPRPARARGRPSPDRVGPLGHARRAPAGPRVVRGRLGWLLIEMGLRLLVRQAARAEPVRSPG